MKKIFLGFLIVFLILSIVLFKNIDKNQKYEIRVKDGLYGIVNHKKDEKVPMIYEKILKLKENYILLKDKKIIVLDDKLNKKYEYVGNDIYYLNEYNFLLKNDENYFAWSRERLFLVDQSVEQVYDKYLVKRENGKIVVKDIFTNEILISGYDGIFFQTANDIIAEKNGKYGVIDKNNKEKILLKYDKISPLIANNYYIIEENFKCGVIDLNGKILIPLKYQFIENIIGKYVIVYSEEGIGVINITNEVIVPCIYDKIEIKEKKIFCYIQDKIEKIYNIRDCEKKSLNL